MIAVFVIVASCAMLLVAQLYSMAMREKLSRELGVRGRTSLYAPSFHEEANYLIERTGLSEALMKHVKSS